MSLPILCRPLFHARKHAFIFNTEHGLNTHHPNDMCVRARAMHARWVEFHMENIEPLFAAFYDTLGMWNCCAFALFFALLWLLVVSWFVHLLSGHSSVGPSPLLLWHTYFFSLILLPFLFVILFFFIRIPLWQALCFLLAQFRARCIEFVY